MNKIWHELTLFVGNINANHVALVLFVIALAMFVVAAGAPEAGGSTLH